MISFEEAVTRLKVAAEPLPADTVPLADAHGRVLAKPVVAQLSSPAVDVSTMDGYAVRTADLAALPASLRVIGQSLPGQSCASTVQPGTAVRIFTGAPLPAAADRVIIQEHVRREGEHAIVGRAEGATNIRVRASDFAAGDVLVEAGIRLTPRALVAAAAADLAEVEVYRRPRLRLIATGDELVPPGTARTQAGTIPESVSIGLLALATEWGAESLGKMHLPDDLTLMRPAAMAAAEGADLVVVTGGASVGERDFARTMFEDALELVFSKVAIKPGKPVWFGRVDSAWVMGLPGNPTSALVTARLLLAPLLARLSGRDLAEALAWRQVPLGEPLGPTGDRETFSRGRVQDGAVRLLPNQDSGSQRTLAQADLLVRREAEAEGYRSGDPIPVLEL